MKKIKVLHIIPELGLGGAEKMLLYYARFLDKEKFEIMAASCVGGGVLAKDLATAGAVVRVNSRRQLGGRLRVWFNLGQTATNWRPDILHTHLFGGDLVGWVVKTFFLKKIFWVATIHNRDYGFSWLRVLVWKIILRRANKIIAVSTATAEYARARLQVPQEKITVINNGIDLMSWLQISPVLNADAPLRIAVIGRLTKQKGQVYLFQALARLKSPWQLYVFGQGEDKNKLVKLARICGIADKIIWVGPVSDLAGRFNEIDLVVAPSLWEGLSLSVIEAMAASKAIVASAEAGRDLIQNQMTGLTVAVGAVDELFAAIKKLSQEAALRRRLGANAREYAREHFDITDNVRAVEKIYAMALGDGKSK